MSVISQDQYVVLEYRLTLDTGEQIRGSNEGPALLTFVAGCKELLPALERRLWGLREKDEVEFVVPAAEAFGLYEPENVQSWSRKVFPPEMTITPGQKVIPANLPFPPEYPLVVKEVQGDTVILDMNHPFAGHDLHYAVRVMEVRPATAEELKPLKECKDCQEDMEEQCEH
jgi:FKBP-type peptidyl-prolyl cis-trans isomerase SlyD